MFNNHAVRFDHARLEGQRPFIEWDTSLTQEGLFGGLSILLPEDARNAFLGAWRDAGQSGLADYHYRDVPVYDGSRLYLSSGPGRTLTAYAFLRSASDGLPLPPVGSYVIPIFRDHHFVEATHNVRQVTGHHPAYIRLDGDEDVASRAWLEFPTEWRPEGATETPEPEAQAPQEERVGGKTAEEWKAEWDRFWTVGRERAVTNGYLTAFRELAEEFEIDPDPFQDLTFTVRVPARSSLFGNRGVISTYVLQETLRTLLNGKEDVNASMLSVTEARWEG